MDDHITAGRQNMHLQLVPRTPVGLATSALIYIMHQAQQVSLTAPPKKKTLAERWDLQASSLYRLSNVPGSEELPEICQTLASLTKENAWPVFEIAYRESARALLCKGPWGTHTVSILLLWLHLFTKDPEYVNDTVNIFQFPNLSLSAGSKSSMVTRIRDTALDANILTLYSDAAALMKQERIPPIVG